MMNVAFTMVRGSAIAAAIMSLAACATLPEASSSMQLGVAANAPSGFLDYCEREEGVCGDAATVQTQVKTARDMFWRTAFSAPVNAAPAATKGTPDKVDWEAVFAAAKTKAVVAKSAAVTKEREIASVEVLASTKSKPVLDEKLWARMNAVNRKFNAVIVRRADQMSYGVDDYWATPVSSGAPAYGDCEDYVLEKRKALIAEGVPQSALSAAIVTTPWGETHAVLLVDTDRGEYVLDNLSSFITPWAKTAYVWRERQFDGEQFKWAMPAFGVARTGGLMTVAAR